MKHILYCRKSQESEDRQVQSLDAQERELKEKAALLGIEISAIYHESMSAKTVGRPVFNEVIKQIQLGKADGLIVWKLDRLARNFIDGGLVIDLLQRGVLKSIQTYDKEYLPTDNVLMMAVELGMANQYSRDLSDNVKRGNRQKLTQGGWPCNAPFGYRNNKADKTVFIDPVHGKHVQMIFDYYSTGLYSFGELAKVLYKKGLRSKTGNKVYKGQVQKILNNIFYYGVVAYVGKHYEGKHEALISKDLFDKCQAVMNIGSKPRRKKHLFPLTGLLTCMECGCAITAQKQKAYNYYHCTNGKGNCSQKRGYIREELLEEQLGTIFDEVTFDDEIIELMYQSALERLECEGVTQNNAIENTQNELTALKGREDRLLDVYMAQSIDKDVYEQKQEEIKKDRITLNQSINDLNTKHQDPRATIERTKKLFKDSNRAKHEYMSAVPERKREIMYEVLSNGLVKDKNILAYQLKSPYDILAGTPNNSDSETLCAMRDLNSRPSRCKRAALPTELIAQIKI
jgi:site-specific DNA recombinase